MFMKGGIPVIIFNNVNDVRGVMTLARSARKAMLEGNAGSRITDGLNWLQKAN
jgi:hypothetical protein